MSWDGGKNVQTRAELEEAEQCTCGHARVAHEDNVGFCWDCDACAADPACREFVERVLKRPDWIGGASGFMVGFAFNCVRAIKGASPAPNPAIVEIGVPAAQPSEGDERA